jgi:hypothetical protein
MVDPTERIENENDDDDEEDCSKHGATLNEPARSFTQRVICMGSCVFQARPGSPGSDGASPYRLLVVLVLDLF